MLQSTISKIRTEVRHYTLYCIVPTYCVIHDHYIIVEGFVLCFWVGAKETHRLVRNIELSTHFSACAYKNHKTHDLLICFQTKAA